MSRPSLPPPPDLTGLRTNWLPPHLADQALARRLLLPVRPHVDLIAHFAQTPAPEVRHLVSAGPSGWGWGAGSPFSSAYSANDYLRAVRTVGISSSAIPTKVPTVVMTTPILAMVVALVATATDTNIDLGETCTAAQQQHRGRN